MLYTLISILFYIYIEGGNTLNKYDVIVAGGGFAGVSAAISAARGGASVLLIEYNNCLGGAAAECLVNPFMPFHTKGEDGKLMLLSTGIFSEICDNMKKLDCELNGREYVDDGKPMHTFNEELLKIVLQRMVLEAGVKLLFHTRCVGVKKNGERIEAVTVSNKSGIYDIEATCFIDCTGDADISAMSGCPVRVGREADGLCQPMTLCFRVSNINIPEFNKVRGDMQKLYKQMRAEGKIKNVREDILIFPTMSDNTLHFNSTRVVKHNPISAEEVTEAELIAREQVLELFAFLKKNAKGFENAVLSSTAMRIGVRESRMIDGDYILTQEDLVACTRFEDSISVCNYDIDIHNPEGSGTSHYYFKDGTYYTIPYRCLTARNNVNLLVAGRCISSTHEAQASYRIMPTCCTLGQAAGTAAAMSVSLGGDVRKIDVKALQTKLKQDGMCI